MRFAYVLEAIVLLHHHRLHYPKALQTLHEVLRVQWHGLAYVQEQTYGLYDSSLIRARLQGLALFSSRPPLKKLKRPPDGDLFSLVGDKVPHWNTPYRLRALRGLLAALPSPTAPLPERKRKPKSNRAKRLKDDQEAKLCQAYEAGTTRRQLADDFGISPKTVTAILKRQGVKSRWRKLTEADIDEAVRLYSQGLSLERVGERLGVNGGTVSYQLNKRGVQMRDSHGRY